MHCIMWPVLFVVLMAGLCLLDAGNTGLGCAMVAVAAGIALFANRGRTAH